MCLGQEASSGNENVAEVLLGHIAAVTVWLATSVVEAMACLQTCKLPSSTTLDFRLVPDLTSGAGSVSQSIRVSSLEAYIGKQAFRASKVTFWAATAGSG